MTWTVRHQGSPRAVTGLSADEVVEGLRDGQWEATDEVRGDDDQPWQPLETHPQFAEAVADLDMPPPKHHPDESRLDMNPIIDVSLVLLIFFILTTSYETIRKVLDLPGASSARPSTGVRRVTAEQVKSLTIRVTARTENGRPVVKVEDEGVRIDDLPKRLGEFARASLKRQLLLDAKGVEWGTVVTILDAARAAGIEKTLFATPPAKPAG